MVGYIVDVYLQKTLSTFFYSVYTLLPIWASVYKYFISTLLPTQDYYRTPSIRDEIFFLSSHLIYKEQGKCDKF